MRGYGEIGEQRRKRGVAGVENIVKMSLKCFERVVSKHLKRPSPVRAVAHVGARNPSADRPGKLNPIHQESGSRTHGCSVHFTSIHVL